MLTRLLARDELPRIHEIDRREYIANIYRLKDGELVLEPHNFDVPGWPPGHEDDTMPHVFEAFDRGGEAWAAFDGDIIAGAVVTDVKRVGVQRDLVQMYWLHVSRSCRGTGLAVLFIDKALDLARRSGAAGIYISATPSEHTVNFYRNRGATLLPEPDPDLFALEPEDIHLERRLGR